MSNHPIVHIEIPAKDIAGAEKFYGELFGWNIQSDPTYNYSMFQAEGGPGGGFVTTGAEGTDGGHVHYKPDSLLVYVATDDIDASLAKVEELGGKTVLPKTEIPQVGWFGIFTDPTGNRVALYTSLQQQG
jgi:predicted enzyme related to lactoylglutathione lyase